MPRGTPASAVVSAWVNAALKGDVTPSDAANACEHATGQLEVSGRHWMELVNLADYARAAIPVPGDPCGVSVAGASQAVALGDNLVLAYGDFWTLVATPHSVPHIDSGWARTNLLAVAAGAQAVLEGLATTGDRSTIDAEIAASGALWPPAMTSRARDNAVLATRFLIVTRAAAEHADVPSSRSQASMMSQALSEVAAASRLLLCAAVSI